MPRSRIWPPIKTLYGVRLLLERLDLVVGSLPEAVGERVAGLKLGGVDEDGAAARHRLTVDDVVEELEGASLPALLVLLGVRGLAVAGDPLVHHLRRGCSVQHDDEHRRRLRLAGPRLVSLDVVAIERHQR